jgi:hypothetical protein
MLRVLVSRLALCAIALACTSVYVGAQQLRGLTVGLKHRTSSDLPAPPPSSVRVTASAMGWAAILALGGASVGGIVDQSICERRHGHEQGTLFGPCFAYAAAPTATGWFGGSLVGATVGAARMARKRGCPRQAAGWRAFGGALLGVAPGMAAVLSGGDKFPARRSALIFTAPVLAGAGAAAAVMSCHASRARRPNGR